MKTRIGNIVFLQYQDDFEESNPDFFFSSDTDKQLLYLTEYDYPPYDWIDDELLPEINPADLDNLDKVREVIGAGSEDTITRVDDYFITINSGKGYAGLSKIIETK